jgi:hypothetical protein
MLKRFLVMAGSALVAFLIVAIATGAVQSGFESGDDEGPSLPGVERLRPVGLTGAIRRQRRDGGLLVDLRPKGSGRPIASAIHATPDQLPALIQKHFSQHKVKGRRFVVVIGDEKSVAEADRILEKREGFDVLRYLPADFVERRLSRFLDTDVPQISVAQLHRQQQKFAVVDIQLEDEYSEARIAGSHHVPPYEQLLQGDFSRMPPRGQPVAVY